MLIIPRRSESILFLLGFALIAAAGNLVTASAPASIAAVLPVWMQIAWNVVLFAGCLTALIAILCRESYYSLQVESLGLLMAAGSTLLYGIVVPFYAGWQGALAAGYAIAFGLTMLFRYRRIERVLATPPDKGA